MVGKNITNQSRHTTFKMHWLIRLYHSLTVFMDLTKWRLQSCYICRVVDSSCTCLNHWDIKWEEGKTETKLINNTLMYPTALRGKVKEISQEDQWEMVSLMELNVSLWNEKEIYSDYFALHIQLAEVLYWRDVWSCQNKHGNNILNSWSSIFVWRNGFMMQTIKMKSCMHEKK